MKIHSTACGPVLKQVMKNLGKGSTKDIEAEKKKLDKEIQNLHQKKAALNKEIDNIKSDFAPPKPKDELIRPLKAQSQILDNKIQQMQTEKMKMQSEKIEEASNSDDDKKTNFANKDIECKDNPSSTEEKLKSAHELLKNFTTQTGVTNEAKIKSTSKNSEVLLLKKIASSNVSNTSDSIKGIDEKRMQQHAKNAIATYKIMENNDSVSSGTNVLA